MAIEVSERFGSRRSSGGSYEFLYWVRATTGETDEQLQDAVITASPSAHKNIDRTGITDWEQHGNDLWFATVSYVGDGQGFGTLEADQSFEFDTSTGTQHVNEAFNSNRTVYSLGADSAPDFGTAIGVSGSGEDMTVDGVDIGVKVFDFSVSRKIPIADITTAYLTILYSLSWTYNKDGALTIEFLDGTNVTFPAGTILFKGARGGGVEGERVSITFLFSFSPNLTNFPVDDLTVDSKLGWQYCWAYRLPTVVEDSSGKPWLCPKAVAAYVDDVYLSGDLTQLNID